MYDYQLLYHVLLNSPQCMIDGQSITQKRTGNINLKIENLCYFPTMQVFKFCMKGFEIILPYNVTFLYLFSSKHCGEVKNSLITCYNEHLEKKWYKI